MSTPQIMIGWIFTVTNFYCAIRFIIAQEFAWCACSTMGGTVLLAVVLHG